MTPDPALDRTVKPLRPAMHGRNEADLRQPAELLRLAMLALILRQRRKRAEQLRMRLERKG